MLPSLESLAQHLVETHAKSADNIIELVFDSEQAFREYKLDVEMADLCYFNHAGGSENTSLYRCSCHGNHHRTNEPKIARHKPSKLVGCCYALPYVFGGTEHPAGARYQNDR